MLSCQLKLSASRLPIDSMPRTILPRFAYVIEQTTYSTSGISRVKNTSPCVGYGLFTCYMRPYSCRGTHKDIYVGQTPQVMESSEGQVKSDSFEIPNLTEKMQVDSHRHILESADAEDDEISKRTGHGNKGRVPWNKGQKHSEETRERIRQRTKEALKDPKVRKKMSEAPRTLSDQTKIKIRASLTRLWGKRLKWKRSREKFLQSWAESIAIAAKIGGNDEQELDWDSYDKLKQEIALLQIHRAAEKAKAKEMARTRAARAAEAKAEKMARLAQKRREREENSKVRGVSIRKRNKKSKEEKERLAEFQEVKLKERLLKIQKKKSAINQVSNPHQRPWENFDLEFVKREQLRKGVSLAEQIRFAKNRRAEQLLDKL
ncbi:stress response protein nst1 [Sesamum indicum]|uniref:Stress response protein nst1 n=1 Tax=Sesamum indicum TaxID=4182 RepID=A0A6I9UJN7_SESIN|nr:stress response protein nst1 [Sesamum indicum]